MLIIRTTGQFEKDFKKAKKRGKDMEKIKTVMRKLAKEETLEEKYREHKLTGDYKGHRECHIEPDWLLIYKLDNKNESITFERTGSHSDLFG